MDKRAKQTSNQLKKGYIILAIGYNKSRIKHGRTKVSKFGISECHQ
jgi:hypothetical protein